MSIRCANVSATSQNTGNLAQGKAIFGRAFKQQVLSLSAISPESSSAFVATLEHQLAQHYGRDPDIGYSLTSLEAATALFLARYERRRCNLDYGKSSNVNVRSSSVMTITLNHIILKNVFFSGNIS